jgi:hypothetical protein
MIYLTYISVAFQRTTRWYIRENGTLHDHLKSYEVAFVLYLCSSTFSMKKYDVLDPHFLTLCIVPFKISYEIIYFCFPTIPFSL